MFVSSRYVNAWHQISAAILSLWSMRLPVVRNYLYWRVFRLCFYTWWNCLQISIARHYWCLHTSHVWAFLRTSRLSRRHWFPAHCELAAVIPWRSNSTDQVSVTLPVRMPGVGKLPTLQPTTRLSWDVSVLSGFSTRTLVTLFRDWTSIQNSGARNDNYYGDRYREVTVTRLHTGHVAAHFGVNNLQYMLLVMFWVCAQICFSFYNNVRRHFNVHR
jgi:hypothetical protein